MSARPSPRTRARLDALVEEATVDCYNEAEQVTGLLTLIEENLALPFTTSVLGAGVAVDLTGTDRIVAICTREEHRQPIALLDLPLPEAGARGRGVDRGVPPLGGLSCRRSRGRGCPSEGRHTLAPVSRTSRNAPCPCGSGRKHKRCCADALEHPARVARSHDAVGERIRAWAFEHHLDAVDAALAEIVAGREDLVLGDGDLALIATWTLNDRELPEGDTLAERYARRPDLPAAERDVAHRIASARLGVFGVASVQPGRWIELDELPAGPTTRVLSHDVSRTVRRGDMLVGRLMGGPPSPSLWGPVANLTPAIGREFVDLLRVLAHAQGVPDDPAAIGTLMRSASREITTLLAPGLARSADLDRAA